ncbi:phospholipase A [Helicobacter sp. MIT 99-5507]|uniref:phospholipase A n=1 Tax=Helicobacter sp. MIT 99-5507 TaxID=152489 RepID=UPI000E1F3284|nr:phospholipase A [Helicobacter sp. MIT 99-5507]RDU58010.1 hypothetical protein CQA42_03670 [Helicobacter sp. MIT 99-5507]
MRYILVYVLFITLSLANDTTNSNSQIKNQTNTESSKDNYINYEFPRYDDINIANSILHRLSIHNENYFMPLYYSISDIRKPYKPYEVKMQISAKVNLFDDILFGIGLFFAYTQISFFQMYSGEISAPFRDSDYMPELTFYRALDWKLFGGEFYNIRFGYLHRSNGEEMFNRSRGIDRIVTELMYRNGNFRANIKGWFYVGYDPTNIRRYVGYSDLKLGYIFLERNHIYLTIHNLFHNYKNYKGSLLFEYKFNFNIISLYLQYFQGYGDNIYQYNIKSKNIGIGVSIKQ